MVKKSASAPTKKPGGATKRKPTSGGAASPSSKPRKPAPPPVAGGAQPSSASDARPEKPVSAADLRAQQALLDVFADVFAAELGEPTTTTTTTDEEEASSEGPGTSFARALRDVKHALYERNFAAAFGREDYLRAYAARWSPTRALCYARVLRGVAGYLGSLHQEQQQGPANGAGGGGAGDGEARDADADASPQHNDNSKNSDDERKQQQVPELRVLAIGGGAAETAALGAYLSSSPPASLHAHLQLLDTGPWGAIVSSLATRLATAPRLSKYASAAARASNAALVAPAERLRTSFLRRDVLELGEEELRGLLVGRQETKGEGAKGLQPVVLITLLFTLNELYTAAGVGRTTAFLRRLTAAAPEGALLLVVDSPGSYSEAAVGNAAEGESKKKYPMQWLLDHTLLRQERRRDRGKRDVKGEEEGEGEGRKKEEREEEEEKKETDEPTPMIWEKLESADSVWFRLAEGLRYPIQLENMRYQMHLYRARLWSEAS